MNWMDQLHTYMRPRSGEKTGTVRHYTNTFTRYILTYRYRFKMAENQGYRQEQRERAAGRAAVPARGSSGEESNDEDDMGLRGLYFQNGVRICQIRDLSPAFVPKRLVESGGKPKTKLLRHRGHTNWKS